MQIESTEALSIEQLAKIVSQGQYPDACHLVGDLFSRVVSRAATLTLIQQYRLYYFAYGVLMDAICDDLIARHWREHCLNQLYLPLSQMRGIAKRIDQTEHFKALELEANKLSHFFLR